MTAPVLHTERLTLRPHVMADWEPMAALLGSEDARFIGGPYDAAGAWALFAADSGAWALLGCGAWGVEERATGAFVGQVGLNRPPHFPEAEIGWLTLAPFRGRGYAREAAEAARAHAFGALGWATAVSYVDPENAASASVARALGCALDPRAAPPDPTDLVFRHPSPAALGAVA